MHAIGLLGPLEVTGPGGVRPVTGSGERQLLALLVLSAGQVVARDRLVDRLWGEELPGRPDNALQKRLSRIRAQLRSAGLDPAVVATREPGYLLDATGVEVDVSTFEELVGRGRRARDAGDPSDAREQLKAALELWRGPALADVDDLDWVVAERARLEEQRLGALEDLLDCELRIGEVEEAIAGLRRLVADHPLRERARLLLMLGLYRTGRQAEALATYDATRELLAEELGLDPSEELRELQRAILRQDASLRGPRSETPAEQPKPPVPVAAPAQPPPLPARMTTFVGRQDERALVASALGRARLVTLVGPGGVGKTSLAVEVARQDGPAALVRLAAVAGPEQVAEAVARQLGVPPPATPRPWESLLVARLAGEPLLLVLDNCEHVVDAAATLTQTLLEGCPEMRVLATSREALAVPGEVQLPVGPLDPESSVGLFLDRAWAVDPTLAVDEESRRAAERICRRLDDLPLAIELAAARVRAVPLATLADRVEERLDVLGGRQRTAEARQRTLQATVDWSHDLLDEGERMLFRRLGVFRGGWELPQAEHVCGFGGLDPDRVPAVLEALVEKSLVRRLPGRERWAMLTVLREYALDRLREHPDEEVEALDRHVSAYTELAEITGARIRTAAYAEATRRLEGEHDNLLAALDRCVETRDDDPDRGLRLADALAWFWYYGARQEGLRYLTVLVQAGAASPFLRACGLQTIGLVGLFAPSEQTRAAARESLAVFEGLVEPVRAAQSAVLVGMEGRYRDDDREYRDLAERARATLLEAGDAWFVAITHFLEVQLWLRRADHARAAEASERTVELLRSTGDGVALSGVLCHLGLAHRMLGRPEEARRALEEARAIMAPLGLPHNLAFALTQLGHLELDEGDVEAAGPLLEEGLGVAVRAANPRMEGWARLGLARLAAMVGDRERSRGLAVQAGDLLRGNEFPWVLDLAAELADPGLTALG